MSKTLGAIKLRITEIVLKEKRPFCIADLQEFEIGQEKHQIAYGTVKNIISLLKKTGFVEPAFSSRPAFYTIRGKKFNKKMTLNHMGVPSAIVDESALKQTPLYKWVKNRPFEQQALHNIRLTFQACGIWNVFSKVYPDNIEDTNQDIHLPSLSFFNYIDAIITVHRSDTVSIALSCSQRPIAIQTEDFLQLYEMLARIEERLSKIVDQQTNESVPQVSIPNFRKWIVKLWHFGVDSVNEYNGKAFQVTFEQG